MWLTLLLAAGTPTKLVECRVSVGEVQSCMATGFNGEAPLEVQGGRVKLCQVSVGQAASCPYNHTGTAVLLRDGRYHTCKVASGFVTGCRATGFTGTAVLAR